MNRRKIAKTSSAGAGSISSQDLQPISLPKPQTSAGKSVLAALNERKTDRDISTKKISLQMLSNLLWAAFGFKGFWD
jgi:hypothetical protein